MVGTQGWTAPEFCAECGQPIPIGARVCPSCATPVSSGPSAPRVRAVVPSAPPVRDRASPKALGATIGVVVAVVVVLASLAVIPVAQRTGSTTQVTTSGSGVTGCGATPVGSIQTYPAGKTVHFSWTTTPATSVTVSIVDQESGPIFSGLGSSGSGTFVSNGDQYGFEIVNCENQGTTVTVSVYYNFDAPLL